MALAFALCALCAWQWHFQTVQRARLEDREQEINRRDTAILHYTNDLDTTAPASHAHGPDHRRIERRFAEGA